MDELKTAIDLKSLTDEQIKKQGFENLDLWMFKSESGETFGPFDTKSLKIYSEKYHYLLENGQVYNLEIEAWYDIFALAQFQRRKPKLVPAQNLAQADSFHLLIKGQKEGPYTSANLQEMLDGGQILPSVELSIDAGNSWIKLYEHHLFDRRFKKTNQNLPFTPSDGILKESDTIKPLPLQKNETQDALATLAHLGTSAESSFDNTQKINLYKTSHNQEKNHKAYYAFTFGAVFMLVGMATFMSKSDNTSSQNIAESSSAPSNVHKSRSRKMKRSPSSVKPQHKSFKKVAPPVMKKFEIKKAKRPELESRPESFHDDELDLEAKNARFKAEIFEKHSERFDIDDPEIREGLTRHLAGESEFEDPEGPDAQVPIEEFFEDHEAIIEENQFED